MLIVDATQHKTIFIIIKRASEIIEQSNKRRPLHSVLKKITP